LSVTWDRSVVISINKTDRHEITEILLKVALNTINPITLILERLAQSFMIHRHEVDQHFILSCTCSIWAGKLHRLENFCYIHFLCSHWQKYSFCWYPCHMLPVELWEPSCKSSSLPVDRKYQKLQSRENCIILSFNSRYKCKWFNVIFLQD
jgi:hypothetical protein